MHLVSGLFSRTPYVRLALSSNVMTTGIFMSDVFGGHTDYAAHAHVLLSKSPLPAQPHLQKDVESMHIASDGGLVSVPSKVAYVVGRRRTVRNHVALSASSAKSVIWKRTGTQTKPGVPVTLHRTPAQSAPTLLAADSGASVSVTFDGSASSPKSVIRKLSRTQTEPVVPVTVHRPPAKSASALPATASGASLLVTSDGTALPAKSIIRKRAETQTKPGVPVTVHRPPPRSASALLAADNGASMRVTSDGDLFPMRVHNQSSAWVTRHDHLSAMSPRRAAFALPAESVVRRHKRTQTQPAVAASAHQPPAVPAAPAVPAQPSSVDDILLAAFNFGAFLFSVIGFLVCVGFFFIRFSQSRGDDSMQTNMDILPQMSFTRSDRKSVPPRIKALRVSMANSKNARERDVEDLRRDLQDAGVLLHASERTRGLQDLFKEVQAGTCGVQWVNDPMKGLRLIRLVRLYRGLLTLHSEEHGASVLTEESRTKHNATDGTEYVNQIQKPVTLKLRLDEKDPLEQGQAFMAHRLDMPQRWQDKYLKLENDTAFSYVEEVESKHYPGLATWYLIEEWLFRIDLSSVPDEDCHVLGLPDQQVFTTMCTDSNDREVTHAWKWLPQCAVATAHWKQGDKSSLSVGDFRAAQRKARGSGDESPTSPTMGRNRSVAREASVNRSGRSERSGRYSVARSQSRRSMAQGRTRSITRQGSVEESI